ncbi:MAG: SDR family NAD(P)-dependent oxidoreductase [Flavisolibacter sp.]|nr:SDR family NAD(P)-dependent oxidoreductase [Flavisolibacter sp.]
MMEVSKPLKNISALVTGGSRGVGRGIALGLGEYGATVYITGRNSKDLEETAVSVEKLGGLCVPLKCDHNNDSETKAVFDYISKTGNPLSLLVNCAWGGYENLIENGTFTWGNKFWEQPIWRWDKIFTIGVRTIFVNSKYAIEIMDTKTQGVIVNISFWAAQKYVGNVIYGASKAAADKLTSDMAVELANSEIAIVSLYPGMVRTEAVLEAAAYLDLSNSESPQFIGRVIAQLYLDPHLKEKSGKVYIAAALAKEYGISDIDGKQPRPLTIEDV